MNLETWTLDFGDDLYLGLDLFVQCLCFGFLTLCDTSKFLVRAYSTRLYGEGSIIFWVCIIFLGFTWSWIVCCEMFYIAFIMVISGKKEIYAPICAWDPFLDILKCWCLMCTSLEAYKTSHILLNIFFEASCHGRKG